MNSGAGNDVITFSGQGAISGGTGNDTITGGNVASLIDGGSGNDSLTGGTAADAITGGQGDDTIVGGGGADLLAGGGGADQFNFANHITQASLGSGGVAVISDWVNTDSLKFGALGAGATFYHNDSLTATSFNNAIGVANGSAHIAGDKYFAVQVGADVVVFADSNADHAIDSTDDAIILTGKTLADIVANGSNFI